MDTLRVLFINDSTTSPNWGDRASAVSVMAMIRAAGGQISHAVTEDELRFSTFATATPVPGGENQSKVREVATLCIPPVLFGIRRRVLSRLGNLRPSRLIPERWEDFQHCANEVLQEQRHAWPVLLRAIEGADVAVIHGDGAMVGNGVIPRTDLFLAYLIKRHFGKPVTIVNHTVDFDHANLRRMAANVYPLFDDVVFRDPISAETHSSMCGGHVAADTAFWFEPARRDAWAPLAGRPTYFDIWPDQARLDPSEPYLCLGGSSLLHTAWKPAQMARDFVALIESIRAVYPGQIVLAASDTGEQLIFESIAAEFELPLVGVTTPVQQAVDILGNADAYVGGRWHPAIFALRGGAPVVAMSAKTFKMQSLMRSAGLPETTFDALDLAAHRHSMVSLLQQHLKAGVELRERLRAWSVKEAAKSWDNVAFLRQYQREQGAADPAVGL
jgi:polysaccharide pyruvyl transferase WcaK-like protein